MSADCDESSLCGPVRGVDWRAERECLPRRDWECRAAFRPAGGRRLLPADSGSNEDGRAESPPALLAESNSSGEPCTPRWRQNIATRSPSERDRRLLAKAAVPPASGETCGTPEWIQAARSPTQTDVEDAGRQTSAPTADSHSGPRSEER